MYNYKKAFAFTLIELMVSLSILLLVLSLGFAGLNQLLSNNQNNNSITRLQHSIWQARTLAIKQRQSIVICPSTEGQTCSSNPNWEQGWIIKNLKTEKIYWKENALPKAQHLTWRGFSKHITFQPDGLTSISNGHFVLCRENSTIYQATVNRQGRLKPMMDKPVQKC